MRSAAWAPWRFSHCGQNPGLLILREILDSGRRRAKGRIAAAASEGPGAGVKEDSFVRSKIAWRARRAEWSLG